MKNKVFSLALIAAMVMSLLCGTAAAVAPVDGIVAKNNTTGTTYEYLVDALDEAISGQTVIVVGDCELDDNATVKSGVTLVVPTSASYNDTFTGNNAGGAVKTGSAYVTLTVPENITLTVNGTMLVAGNQQSTNRNASCLTGDFGKVDVDGGSLVVNGTLYARGEVSGTGTVTANNGSTVYQMLQIRDWRGGTATMGAYGTNNVFPFNLYEISNITAKTSYMNGSTLKGQYFIVASGNGVPGSEIVIGTDGQMEFDVTPDTKPNDKVVFEYDANKNATVTVAGAIKTGHITVSMSVYGFNYTVSSANTVCPFGYNMDVVIANGGSLSISNQMKFLPGCDVTIENGGELAIEQGGEAYFYGAGGYDKTYNYLGWPTAAPAGAAYLHVNEGGVVMNNGVLASTDATFANVDGFTASETTAPVKEVTQNGSTVTLVPVTFYTYVAPTVEG